MRDQSMSLHYTPSQVPHLRTSGEPLHSLFHRSGFFGKAVQPGDLQAAGAVVEAYIGLFIEITFLATFTQHIVAPGSASCARRWRLMSAMTPRGGNSS